MDRVDIIMDAINALVPNAQYNIYGDFSGLQWLDSRTAPKEADVKKKYDEIIAEEENMQNNFGFLLTDPDTIDELEKVLYPK